MNLAFLPTEEILNKGFNDLVESFLLFINSLTAPKSLDEGDFIKSNCLDLNPNS